MSPPEGAVTPAPSTALAPADAWAVVPRWGRPGAWLDAVLVALAVFASAPAAFSVAVYDARDSASLAVGWLLFYGFFGVPASLLLGLAAARAEVVAFGVAHLGRYWWLARALAATATGWLAATATLPFALAVVASSARGSRFEDTLIGALLWLGTWPLLGLAIWLRRFSARRLASRLLPAPGQLAPALVPGALLLLPVVGLLALPVAVVVTAALVNQVGDPLSGGLLVAAFTLVTVGGGALLAWASRRWRASVPARPSAPIGAELVGAVAFASWAPLFLTAMVPWPRAPGERYVMAWLAGMVLIASVAGASRSWARRLFGESA